MRIRQQEVTVEREDVNQEIHKKVILEWKKEPMIRVHSVRATVKEILQTAHALQVVKVGIVGEPSTGKTTLAKTLAHLIHKMSEIPFAVRVFGKDEFLNMEKTLQGLTPANYILIFDDLSFLSGLANKRQIEEVKRIVSVIRHLKEDVRIILVYDYHYTLGLDKYLRQANYRYFTSVGSSEDDNMIKIVGTKYVQRIKDFQTKFVKMTTEPYKAPFKIGKSYFAYNYKNPFVPCLFFNNVRLRYIVFPTREWIDPICSICSMTTGVLESAIPVDQFCKEAEAKLGKGVFEAAVKLELFANGMNVYAPSVVSASKYLARAMEKKLISLQEIAVFYGLEITKSRLRKKLDGVLE